MAIALTGGRLVDGTGRDPVDDVTVVVEGDRVAAVGRDVARPADVEAIDVDGLTVLPGLIDLHTHMGIIEVVGAGSLSAAEVAAHLFRNAERCLQSGHTTAREVAGADGGLRRAIDAGLVPGPRLFPSGPMISQTGGHGDHDLPWLDHHHAVRGIPGLSHAAEVVDGPDGVRGAARRAFQHGATQLKVCASGGVVSLTDSLTDTQFTVDELRAAVEEAEARGTYVTAHAHNAQAIRNGLEAGLACFEHGTWLDEETAARMAAAGAALVPTFATVVQATERWQELGIPEDLLPRYHGVLDAMRESLHVAIEAGVTIGSGSDILGPNQRDRGIEIALKAEVMGAMDAIVAATRTSAEILRAANDLGTVEVGRVADVIAVAGDPLADPHVLADEDNVVLVVKDGQVVKDIRS